MVSSGSNTRVSVDDLPKWREEVYTTIEEVMR